MGKKKTNDGRRERTTGQSASTPTSNGSRISTGPRPQSNIHSDQMTVARQLQAERRGNNRGASRTARGGRSGGRSERAGVSNSPPPPAYAQRPTAITATGGRVQGNNAYSEAQMAAARELRMVYRFDNTGLSREWNNRSSRAEPTSSLTSMPATRPVIANERHSLPSQNKGNRAHQQQPQSSSASGSGDRKGRNDTRQSSGVAPTSSQRSVPAIPASTLASTSTSRAHTQGSPRDTPGQRSTDEIQNQAESRANASSTRNLSAENDNSAIVIHPSASARTRNQGPSPYSSTRLQIQEAADDNVNESENNKKEIPVKFRHGDQIMNATAMIRFPPAGPVQSTSRPNAAPQTNSPSQEPKEVETTSKKVHDAGDNDEFWVDIVVRFPQVAFVSTRNATTDYLTGSPLGGFLPNLPTPDAFNLDAVPLTRPVLDLGRQPEGNVTMAGHAEPSIAGERRGDYDHPPSQDTAIDTTMAEQGDEDEDADYASRPVRDPLMTRARETAELSAGGGARPNDHAHPPSNPSYQ